MFKFEDHIDHYDDVFEELPSAIQHMNSMIQCDVADISKSHYCIIDGDTGEVVSEYISDNYHLFTKEGIIKRLIGIAEAVDDIAKCPIISQDEIPAWLIKDVRNCSRWLSAVANAMDASLPHTGY